MSMSIIKELQQSDHVYQCCQKYLLLCLWPKEIINIMMNYHGYLPLWCKKQCLGAFEMIGEHNDIVKIGDSYRWSVLTINHLLPNDFYGHHWRFKLQQNKLPNDDSIISVVNGNDFDTCVHVGCYNIIGTIYVRNNCVVLGVYSPITHTDTSPLSRIIDIECNVKTEILTIIIYDLNYNVLMHCEENNIKNIYEYRPLFYGRNCTVSFLRI